MRHIIAPAVIVLATTATAGCTSQELAAINAPASSTPQSCSAQVAAWRNDGNDDAMQAVVDSLSAVQDATAAWAQDLSDGADTSSDVSQIDSAAGSLQSDAQSAQGNLPPSCMPGMRAADSAFLADAVKVAGKAEAGARLADAGRNAGAVKDFLSAKGETGAANKKFDSAVSDAQGNGGS